jgi:hypothetical protein
VTEAQGRSALERHRGFLLLSASTAVLFATSALVWGWFGRALIEASGGSGGLIGRVLGSPPGEPLNRTVGRGNTAMAAAAAIGISLYVLVALIHFARGARWRIGWIALVVIAWWVGVELLAAPYLRVPLGLANFYFVRDPDHHPRRAQLPEYNADSLRCRHEPETFRDEDLNLVFLGDSFTFGVLLPPEQAFPQKVEAILSRAWPQRVVKVANFGWPSSSPLLSWRLLAQIGERYRPDWVVMCVDMTDFHDDILWQNMLERRGIYWFYDKLPITLAGLHRFLPPLFWKVYRWSNDNLPEARYFMARAPLETTRAFARPLADNLDRLQRWCAEHGARFAVVVLPRSFQYSARECPNNWEADRYEVLGPHALEPFRFFDELRARADYPIHSLLPAFQASSVFPTCFDADPHWNDNGTTVAAEAIAAILRSHIESAEAR